MKKIWLVAIFIFLVLVVPALRLGMLIKTVIVEDELHSRESLHELLTEFCPQVDLVAIAITKDEAVGAISHHKPDLIFLDLELHGETGFEVLKELGYPDIQVIFTTAPGHPSIKVIQFCGASYLLKPIDIESLQVMIHSAEQKKSSITSNLALKHLHATLQNNGKPEHLYIPNMIGGEYVVIDDILRIEVQEKDAMFIMKSGIPHPSIHSIRDYEILLEGLPFFRTDHTHMINLKEIAAIRSKDDMVEMSDGSLVPLSPERKDALYEIKEQLTNYGNNGSSEI